MIPLKTPTGQQVLKDRSIPLTPRQRAALIVIDGKRSIAEVLQSSGVATEDVERLFELGLVADTTVSAKPGAAAEPWIDTAAQSLPELTPQQRYAAAYPIATRLTAGLGLRGLRLNLAVEAATCYEDLLALSGKIRDAVGAEKFIPLREALGAA